MSPHRRDRIERNNRLANQISTQSYRRIAVPMLIIGLVATVAGLVGGLLVRAAGGVLLLLAGIVVLAASRFHNATVLRDDVPDWGREFLIFLLAVAIAAGGVLCLR